VALSKVITDERGVTASYFRVTAIIEQYISETPSITVQLMGYADATYRDREKLEGQSLANAFREFYLSEKDELGYTRADIYRRLAAEIPEFAGAKEI